MKDTKQIGDVSVTMILAALLHRGHNVLVPFEDRQPYDLVLEENGKFTRIKCKSGRLLSDTIRFNLCTVVKDPQTKKHVHKPYGDTVDAFGVYCRAIHQCFLVPASVLGKFEGSLRLTPPKNGSTYLMAKDYQLPFL